MGQERHGVGGSPGQPSRADEARERIEEARSLAAAAIVQQQPSAQNDPSLAEERLAEAVQAAADPEAKPADLERLAQQAEQDRDVVQGRAGEASE